MTEFSEGLSITPKFRARWDATTDARAFAQAFTGIREVAGDKLADVILSTPELQGLSVGDLQRWESATVELDGSDFDAIEYVLSGLVSVGAVSVNEAIACRDLLNNLKPITHPGPNPYLS